MLEGLDEVDWGALQHAYGSAADVPGQLRTLRSPDPEARNRALDKLYGNIFHQGTRYPASAAAAPFLLELAVDPSTPDRPEILHLLTALAIGLDSTWLPDTFPVADYRARQASVASLDEASDQRASTVDPELRDAVAARFGVSADDQLRNEWLDQMLNDAALDEAAFTELAAYDAVRAGVPAVSALLADDESPALRVAAAYALGWFPEEAATSLPALMQAAAAKTHATVAATALVAMGLAGGAEQAEEVEPMLFDPRVEVRWGAAVALARLRGRSAGPRVAAELLPWVGGSGGPQPEIPFLDGDLAGYAVRALAQLGKTDTDAWFDVLLARLTQVSGPQALEVARTVLKLAFPAGPLPTGTPLSALDRRQRQLVEVLASSPAAWTANGPRSGNFVLLVGGYGLPISPAAMRTYVAGHE